MITTESYQDLARELGGDNDWKFTPDPSAELIESIVKQGNVRWVCPYSRLGLWNKFGITLPEGVESAQMISRLKMGPPDADIVKMADQSYNYTPDQWRMLEKDEGVRQFINIRKALKYKHRVLSVQMEYRVYLHIIKST